MNDIKKSVESLTSDVDKIVDAISGIDTNITEASQGVGNIAEKTTDMVSETSESLDKVKECKQAVANLNDIINKFTL